VEQVLQRFGGQNAQTLALNVVATTGGDDGGRQAGTQVAAATMIMVATSRVS